MKTNCVILLISAMLILLFTYTAISKLLDFETFRGQLLNQPLPALMSRQLAWAVPIAELISVVFLIIKPLRVIGLLCALVLMTVFTLYVSLILLDTFDRVPCSCGGIMEELSWEGHLVVNGLFLMLAASGLVLEIRSKRKEKSFR